MVLCSQARKLAEVERPRSVSENKTAGSDAAESPDVKKLTYREQRELDQLPEQISMLEEQFAELEAQVSAGDFYAQEHEVTAPVLEAFAETQSELDQALERWTELEDRVNAYRESRQR